jgi:hypothetical protein
MRAPLKCPEPDLDLPTLAAQRCRRNGWKAVIAFPAQPSFNRAMIIAVFAMLAAQSPTTSLAKQEPPLQCHVGPLRKTFGGYPWLVYSCSDGATLVVVSDGGNPASPFYFMLHPKGDGYAMSGEGNGSKEASSAAFDDLKRLGATDIAAMLAETKQQ